MARPQQSSLRRAIWSGSRPRCSGTNEAAHEAMAYKGSRDRRRLVSVRRITAGAHGNRRGILPGFATGGFGLRLIGGQRKAGRRPPYRRARRLRAPLSWTTWATVAVTVTLPFRWVTRFRMGGQPPIRQQFLQSARWQAGQSSKYIS